MAASISTANITNFRDDPNVIHSTADASSGDIAVVVIKEEDLGDEWLLNCDSIEEFYEFADTSLPIDVECSELVKGCSILNANETHKHSSIPVNLLPNSAVKSYQETYKDVETTLNRKSKSMLMLNVVGNRDEMNKCDKQPTHATSVNVDRKEIVQPRPQKSGTEESEGCQCGKYQFKGIQCSKVFGHEGHLEMHKSSHKQCDSCGSSPKQEIVIKEEVLSDDEGVLNDASVNEYYNIGHASHPVDMNCLEMKDNNSIAVENKSGYVSNVVGVLAGSALKNYNDLKSDLKIASKSVKQHLGNNRGAITKFQNHENSGRSVKLCVKKVKQQLQLETKPMTAPSYAAVPPEHRFKCQECSETFELKSHLVMHEIGHEQCRRYGSFPSYHFSKQLQSDRPLYKCKECNANFELKSRFTLHELLHEKQRTRPCRCRSTSLASASDLCTCVVRVCKLCGRRYFACLRLRNWTLCVKCFLPLVSKWKTNSSTVVKTEGIQIEQVSSKRNRNKMCNRKFFPMLVDVKRLCCSCGKMGANVIRFGTSWMCYDCWNAKLKHKNGRNLLGLSSEIVPQETAEYSRPSCAYCLKLYPLRSHLSNHQCFHKSVYLKDHDVDDFKIGQHFLLPSVEKPFEPSCVQNDLIVWNQSAWFDDYNNSEDEQEGEMVIDTAELSDVNEESSLSNVILCDKTGELIDLRSVAETSASDKTKKSHTKGEIGKRNLM